MNVFLLLTHIGAFIKAGKDVDEIVQSILQHHEKFPSTAEITSLLADVSALLAVGFINMTPDELKTVEEVISSLSDEVKAL